MFSGLPDQLVVHVHGLGHIGVVEQLSIVEHLALLRWRTALMTLSFVVRNIMFCLIIGSDRSFISFRFDGDEILVRHSTNENFRPGSQCRDQSEVGQDCLGA